MNLNKNSISARLYRWFYRVYDMPENLCPYFWQLVIMYVFIIPYSIIALPMVIIKEDDSDARFIGGFLLWATLFIGLIALYAPITYFIWGFGPKNSTMLGLQMGGFICWVISVITLIILGLIKLKDRKKNQKYVWDHSTYEYIPNPDYRPSFATITLEFIKAKYKRYCPKIDWK